jgi:hypothetical protein
MLLPALVLTSLAAAVPAGATTDDSTAPADEQAKDYAALFDEARRKLDLRGGNFLATELQKSERKRYGAHSVLRVPGLYEAARWYSWADRTRQERAALNAALTILEKAYGPRDARLSYPLRTIASSCVRSRSDADLARAVLDRALQLNFQATRADVLERAEVFAVRGDVEALFDTPSAGGGWYKAAWQKLADSRFAGPDIANEMFTQPKPVYVNVPDEPFTSRKGNLDHFTAGTVSFGFTVSALGVIEQLRLRQSQLPIDSIPRPVLEAFRDARYRPRLVAGQPVPTPDHGFALTFSTDERRARRRVSFGQLDHAR